MAKIGRNDPCPCGSGLKYKKCCQSKQPAAGAAPPAGQAPQLSLQGEIDKIRQAASEGKDTVRPLGVFVFFATASGDAWLLELTDMDAVQVAAAGEPLEVELDENPDTIEINWSHRFTIRNKRFVAAPYNEGSEQVFDDYPTHAIHAAIKKIRKKFPPELLDSVHLEREEGESEAGIA